MTDLGFSGLVLWVVGDAMIDIYLRGSAERISPEAPVPVVTLQHRDHMLGGAANVAHNLTAQGAKVCLFGVCGGDEPGRRLRSMLDAHRIGGGLIELEDRPTTTKIRVIAGTHQMVRLDEETRTPLPQEAEDRLLQALQEAPHPDAVIVSDYGKGVVTRRVVDELLRLRPRPWLLVDPKRRQPSFFRGFDFATPNHYEAAAAAGCELDEVLAPESLACLLDSFGGAFLITRGEKGMALVERGRPVESISSGAREVYDVTGAGDTAIAVFALGLAARLTPGEAVILAERAASIAVSRLGTYAVTQAELSAALESNGSHPKKLLSLKQAVALCHEARRLMKRIVFTNGCFDVLHAGHVYLLAEAARRGDFLIVGLNSDASIRRLKGSRRPRSPEPDRATVLSGLECVSAVVLFDEDTPDGLIRQLRPDLLVKGGDYRPHEIVGASHVESYGGEVVVVPYLDGRSTTAILGEYA